jgi:hypothetical protein
MQAFILNGVLHVIQGGYVRTLSLEKETAFYLDTYYKLQYAQTDSVLRTSEGTEIVEGKIYQLTDKKITLV